MTPRCGSVSKATAQTSATNSSSHFFAQIICFGALESRRCSSPSASVSSLCVAGVGAAGAGSPRAGGKVPNPRPVVCNPGGCSFLLPVSSRRSGSTRWLLLRPSVVWVKRDVGWKPQRLPFSAGFELSLSLSRCSRLLANDAPGSCDTHLGCSSLFKPKCKYQSCLIFKTTLNRPLVFPKYLCCN